MKWIRSCQECGHKTSAFKDPNHNPTDKYCNAVCRNCGSVALDYGKEEPETFEEIQRAKQAFEDLISDKEDEHEKQ